MQMVLQRKENNLTQIILPEDDRNVIYGIVKDCYQEPVCDAVVKLIEVCREYGKEERKPVSHTFTDKDGEFVFGPLCPDRHYEIEIWVNKVKHYKVCAMGNHEGKCLKGVDMDCKKDDWKPGKPGKPCDEKPCCNRDSEVSSEQ